MGDPLSQNESANEGELERHSIFGILWLSVRTALLTLGVILLIAAIYIGFTGRGSHHHYPYTRAIADLKTLETQIEIYHDDTGVYPTTKQGLQALITRPTIPPVPKNWQGPYLRNRKSVPLDPWGHPYVYLCPGKHNPKSYHLFSYGPTGKPGGTGDEALIVLWEY